jgi:peptidoglycan/LPS O-acetylase OafA/YrhL
VLSGYVLTTAFFRSGEVEYLVSGAVRRYIRLLVPVSFLLFVVYLFVYPGLFDLGNFSAFRDMISQAFWGVFFQGQTAFGPFDTSYTGVLWTMTVEFIGSFIVFAFASLFGKLRNRWLFYIVVTVLFLHTYFLAFILGMALADLYSGMSREKFAIKNPGLLALIFGVGMLFGTYTLPNAWWSGGLRNGLESLTSAVFSEVPAMGSGPFQLGGASTSEFIYILGAVLVLLSLVNSVHLQKILSTRIPSFLGKISFSLYLMHMIVLYTFTQFIFGLLFPQPSLIAGLFLVIVTTPVLIVCSYLVYITVDLKGMALSRWIYMRFFVPESSP